MDITLAYGTTTVPVTLDDSRVMGVLLPQLSGSPPDEAAELARALDNPLGSPRLRELARPGMTVAIVTSDVTRPCPSRRMLPPLLAELDRAGVARKDVRIVFALGSHRPHTAEEKDKLVGPDILAGYACLDSDPADCALVGTTSRGTPLDIFRPVAEADLRICLGNIEYHYFAGYSGGAKAIFPGTSTPASIQANHRMMVEAEACTGRMDGNPLRADIEELAEFLSVDFILNVVLGPHKEILRAVAGHRVAAHREGCAFLDAMYKFPLAEPADVVLVSAGGYPKDINIYQAQKALDNARFAVRQGGCIILVAACPEGYGSAAFERWIKAAPDPDWLIAEIARRFELGGHKAAAIALALRKATVFSVSDMDEAMARSLFFEPQPTVEAALAAAAARCGPGSRILVMPMGGATLPVVV